jgi:hypothetical protein
MGAVEPEHAGTASGINNAVSRVAGMLAVAILGTVAVGVFGNALDTRLATLDAAPEIRRALDAEVPKFADATVPRAIQGTERQALDTALEESLVESFRIVMLVAAALALMSALCARWIRR